MTKRNFVIFAVLLALILAAPSTIFAQEGTEEEEEPLDCPHFEGSPADVRAGYYMGEGVAFMSTGQYANAIYSYSCIIQQVDNRYIDAYLNRAVAHTLRRSYDLAIEDYTTAIGIDSNFVPAYNNRGIVYTARLEYEEALADFNRALDLDGGYILAFINQGIVYAIQGEYDTAVADFEQAISLAGLEDILELMNREDDPDTTVDESDVEIPEYNLDYAQAYAMLGIIEEQRALDNYESYLQLAGAQSDRRIQSAAGALESRFTFELRFDDGTWLLAADFASDGNQGGGGQ